MKNGKICIAQWPDHQHTTSSQSWIGQAVSYYVIAKEANPVEVSQEQIDLLQKTYGAKCLGDQNCTLVMGFNLYVGIQSENN